MSHFSFIPVISNSGSTQITTGSQISSLHSLPAQLSHYNKKHIHIKKGKSDSGKSELVLSVCNSETCDGALRGRAQYKVSLNEMKLLMKIQEILELIQNAATSGRGQIMQLC